MRTCRLAGADTSSRQGMSAVASIRLARAQKACAGFDPKTRAASVLQRETMQAKAGVCGTKTASPSGIGDARNGYLVPSRTVRRQRSRLAWSEATETVAAVEGCKPGFPEPERSHNARDKKLVAETGERSLSPTAEGALRSVVGCRWEITRIARPPTPPTGRVVRTW